MRDPELQNEFYIKLTGKANIPEPLEIGHNYSVEAQGTITSKTETDKNDGSHFEYFKFEPVIVEIVKDNGERIKAKDTRSKSQLWRSRVWSYWNKNIIDQDFDDFYENLMNRMIQLSEEVIDMYQK